MKKKFMAIGAVVGMLGLATGCGEVYVTPSYGSSYHSHHVYYHHVTHVHVHIMHVHVYHSTHHYSSHHSSHRSHH